MAQLPALSSFHDLLVPHSWAKRCRRASSCRCPSWASSRAVWPPGACRPLETGVSPPERWCLQSDPVKCACVWGRKEGGCLATCCSPWRISLLLSTSEAEALPAGQPRNNLPGLPGPGREGVRRVSEKWGLPELEVPMVQDGAML